jgi:hypothetical protein
MTWCTRDFISVARRSIRSFTGTNLQDRRTPKTSEHRGCRKCPPAGISGIQLRPLGNMRLHQFGRSTPVDNTLHSPFGYATPKKANALGYQHIRPLSLAIDKGSWCVLLLRVETSNNVYIATHTRRQHTRSTMRWLPGRPAAEVTKVVESCAAWTRCCLKCLLTVL